jgi:hypothetical protein
VKEKNSVHLTILANDIKLVATLSSNATLNDLEASFLKESTVNRGRDLAQFKPS